MDTSFMTRVTQQGSGERKDWKKKIALDPLDVWMGKKVEFYSHLTIHIKINSRWFGDWNVKGKELRHLEDNIGEYLYDIW